jgi:hypothetical protein
MQRFCVAFLSLAVAGAAAPGISPLRRGGIARGSAAPAGSASRLEARGALIANPLYASGAPVFAAEIGSTLSLVAAPRPGAERVLCVVDGRAVTEAKRDPAGSECRCDLSFLSVGGMHTAAAYAAAAGGAALLGEVHTFFFRPEGGGASAAAARLRASEGALRAMTPAGTGILGVYYTTYQQQINQLYQNRSRDTGLPPLSMDDVVRQRLRLADSIWRYAPNASFPSWEDGLFMSQEPALGMYCYFRRRANESWDRYGMADCPEGPRVLQTHAAELSSAGFSFIAPDATNWDQDPRDASNGADLNQLRPTEIIAEEWANLRLQGVATPQMSTYDRVNAGGVLWTWYLSEFFNNATLVELDLIARNPNSTRVANNDKIYIVADEPTLDFATVRKIQNNGGLNDIVTPIMWSAPDASGNYEANGYLKYFSPCTLTRNATRVFSSDVFFDPDAPCAHLKTRGSSVGDVWTVSTGLPMNSIPFGGLRYNGLFLKKQFYDVFADPTPTDMLFAPSWNEFAANAHPMAGWDITNTLFSAVGAEVDDEDRFTIIFDDFTSERSRVIEPGKVDGGYYYELFASCMRVYRLQAALGVVSSGAGCDVAGEECCVLHGDELFSELWSLEAAGAGDALLSNSAAEAAALVASGWRELCAPGIDNAVTTSVCFNETREYSLTAPPPARF